MARSVCWLWFLALAGCAGGQTGEITMLGACYEAVDEIALDASSDAGRSAADQLAALTTEAAPSLTWTGEDATVAEVAFTASGDAIVVGGPGCERPFLQVPVEVTLRTDDGRLDERLDGVVLLSDEDLAIVRVATTGGALRGRLDIADEAELRIEIESGVDALRGQLFVRADAESDDELIGSF